MRSLFRCMLMLFGVAVLTGCAKHQVTMSDWQKSVETYIREEGNNDPNSLRDVMWQSSHRGFGVLGNPVARQSGDAVGVLLGHKPVKEQPSFIFLVGLIDHETVKHIRLAALTVNEQGHRWMLGEDDEQALKAYRAYKNNLWRQRFPDRSEAAPAYRRFPGEDDAFELKVTPDQVVAVHQQSGARWILPLRSADNRAQTASVKHSN